jgi:23S rRNA U2552 (ribose-2'-O)-methylase RlmE/FtsJ
MCLCLSIGDRVLDLCAAPGGKSYLLTQVKKRFFAPFIHKIDDFTKTGSGQT